jgi:hypothetical protein
MVPILMTLLAQRKQFTILVVPRIGAFEVAKMMDVESRFAVLAVTT